MSERVRVNLSLRPSMHDLIEDLSNLTGRSKAGLIADFLQDMRPALELTRDGLKALQDKENGASVLFDMFDLADSQIDNAVNCIDELKNSHKE